MDHQATRRANVSAKRIPLTIIPRKPDRANDPAEWNTASYSDHPIDTLEPLPDCPNAFRAAAIGYLKVLSAMDDFLTDADDPRAGWIAVAIVLKLTSVRGLTVADIAHQLGCSPNDQPGLR
jgi:hypothetical protein